jgi:hypothetical protein
VFAATVSLLLTDVKPEAPGSQGSVPASAVKAEFDTMTPLDRLLISDTGLRTWLYNP